MEDNEVSRGELASDRTKQLVDIGMMVGVAFGFLVIEADFIRRLTLLVGAHAHLEYILNASAFQICMIGAVLGYWRCSRMIAVIRPGTEKPDQFVRFLSVTVLMLLLSMMQFSSFVTAFDRAIH